MTTGELSWLAGLAACLALLVLLAFGCAPQAPHYPAGGGCVDSNQWCAEGWVPLTNPDARPVARAVREIDPEVCQ